VRADNRGLAGRRQEGHSACAGIFTPCFSVNNTWVFTDGGRKSNPQKSFLGIDAALLLLLYGEYAAGGFQSQGFSAFRVRKIAPTIRHIETM
jgi:hypothetical protein